MLALNALSVLSRDKHEFAALMGHLAGAASRGKLGRIGSGLRGVGAFSGIGLMLGISAGLGYWLGSWLDERWHTSPWLSLVGLFLGMGAGLLEMMRLLRRFGKD